MQKGDFTHKNGFTLIELVLIIALIGVVGLAVVVLVPSLSVTKLDVATKQVLSDIEFAKQNAMMTGQTSGVQFVSGGAYTVYQGTTATPLSSPLTKTNMVITLSSSYSGISITSSYTVEFNSLGSPTTGGGGSVTISNGTSTKTITVAANTGKITKS